jgi:hypothetical protein
MRLVPNEQLDQMPACTPNVAQNATTVFGTGRLDFQAVQQNLGVVQREC